MNALAGKDHCRWHVGSLSTYIIAEGASSINHDFGERVNLIACLGITRNHAIRFCHLRFSSDQSLQHSSGG